MDIGLGMLKSLTVNSNTIINSIYSSILFSVKKINIAMK